MPKRQMVSGPSKKGRDALSKKAYGNRALDKVRAAERKKEVQAARQLRAIAQALYTRVKAIEARIFTAPASAAREDREQRANPSIGRERPWTEQDHPTWVEFWPRVLRQTFGPSDGRWNGRNDFADKYRAATDEQREYLERIGPQAISVIWQLMKVEEALATNWRFMSQAEALAGAFAIPDIVQWIDPEQQTLFRDAEGFPPSSNFWPRQVIGEWFDDEARTRLAKVLRGVDVKARIEKIEDSRIPRSRNIEFYPVDAIEKAFNRSDAQSAPKEQELEGRQTISPEPGRGPGRPPISERKRKEVYDELLMGRTFAQAAAVVGLSVETVAKIAKDKEISSPHARISDEKRKKILADFEADGNLSRVGRKHGVSGKTVGRIAEAARRDKARLRHLKTATPH